MMNLTFGEQVKIILRRKGMTIKELAERVEQYTGKPMSRQNMTQKLGRDNFQEQDMRLLAKILGCELTLSIMEPTEEPVREDMPSLEREITVGELVDMTEEVYESPMQEMNESSMQEVSASAEVASEVAGENATSEDDITEQTLPQPGEASIAADESEERSLLRKGIKGFYKKGTPEIVVSERKKEEAAVVGDINPYTGKEYQSNSVRMHPKRIGYVQVYDQEQHKWTDMTEWAFLGYQERKKKLLGKDYRPPIYLD